MENEISLKRFTFHKLSKTLSCSSALFAFVFPKQIFIKSHHTGKVVCFIPNDEINVANEFYDGEQMVFMPTEPVKNVELLMVYHEN